MSTQASCTEYTLQGNDADEAGKIDFGWDLQRNVAVIMTDFRVDPAPLQPPAFRPAADTLAAAMLETQFRLVRARP